jgi:hypothetical protein
MACANNTQVCEGCHSTGHHYTECLNHQYVWDYVANAQLLEPGEYLLGPAGWQDIHLTSLHHLICTAIQYYISLHHMQIQDIHTLLIDLEANSQFGDISCYTQYGSTSESTNPEAESVYKARSEGSSPLPTATYPPPSQGPSGIVLINLAVLAGTTCLCVDPWNKTTGYVQFIALHHCHPSFSIIFPDFL